jgi:hypothetical protein
MMAMQWLTRGLNRHLKTNVFETEHTILILEIITGLTTLRQ